VAQKNNSLIHSDLRYRHSRESGNPGLKPFFEIKFKDWIPAFAGMTVVLLASLASAKTLKHTASKQTAFLIQDVGTEFPVDFNKYGTMTGQGTNDFKYKITDRAGLAAAMGTGLYPNGSSLSKDPTYLKWKRKNPGNYNHWDYVNSGNPQDDFYIWATAREVGPGTKLLFTGKALAEAGFTKQALKAFYAVLLNFPKEACWSADHTFVWYVANEALSQIEAQTQQHPEIGLRLIGARFKVKNGGDTDLNNDEFIIAPGRWEKPVVGKPVDLAGLKIINQRGYGKVHLVQYENQHWQLIVNGKPMMIRGVTYSPTPIGQQIASYATRWMFEDANDNGEPDIPYETWVDSNKNNRQDPGEDPVGDFELMHAMHVNAIRLFRTGDGTEYDPSIFNKKVLRDLHERYGISVILGDFLGAYTVGSGAQWDDGTDYTDPVQLENMRRIITDYVKDHRNEPYVLMWILGNENMMPSDYSGVNATRTKAATQVEAYLTFVNEIAELIHRLDPDHPVAVGNLDMVNLDEHKKYAPAVDIFGANLYRGVNGFGTIWTTIQEAFDRPVLITEYGADAWDSRAEREDQKAQADYHKGNWNDIAYHQAGGGAEGNAIGGVAFEFLNKWWKSNKGGWDAHNMEKNNPMAFQDGWASEEWYGLLALGDGTGGPLLRQPRAAYNLYRDKLWK
jgi:beta-glucuronidase